MALREASDIPCNVTFDGSEIRRSPVEVGSLSHYLQGFIMFYTSQVVLAEFLKHQQYEQEILHELWGFKALNPENSDFTEKQPTCPGEQHIASTKVCHRQLKETHV